MEKVWIVLLEAAGEPSGIPISQASLRQLMEAMECEQIVGLHDSLRYAIQLRITSSSPAEALFSALSRWREAAHQFGDESWTLQRSEVLTLAEFERDCAFSEESGSEVALGVEADELLRSVFHDSLTGFPTLALFRDRAHGVISYGATSAPPLALLVIDVDGFGAVNKDLGYIYGDQVLAEVAGRLGRLADSSWAAARLAGDEFVLLVENTVNTAETFAQRLLDAVRDPIVVKGRPIVVTASVGMTPVDSEGDVDEFLRQAGIAMCAAKDAGGDRCRWYGPELRANANRLDFVGQSAPDRLAHVMLLERAALAANECSSLEEAASVVLQQVLAHTGWRAGHLWLVDRTGGWLEPSGVWKISGPEPLDALRRHAAGRRYLSGQGLPGAALASGKPAWTAPRPSESSPAGQPGEVEAGLLGAVAFPVVAGSEVVAVLEFYSTGPISPHHALQDVMAAVGAQLGRIFERTRAAAALACSEERYRMLADCIPALVWATGPDAKCTFVNRRWLEHTGRTMGDEAGDGWADGVHPDDLARCLSAWQDALERQAPFELEYRLLRADGQYRWLLDRGNPILEGGEFAGYVGGCIDVTERRQAELEVRNEEVRFRTLVSTSDVMIVVLDAEGTLIDEYVPLSNLGYPPGEGRGRLGFEYLHPDDLPEAVRRFAAALERPGPGAPFEFRVRHADGSWRWLRAAANNLLADPLVHGIVVTATDITEQKHLAELLRITEERLRDIESRLQRAEEQGWLAGIVSEAGPR